MADACDGSGDDGDRRRDAAPPRLLRWAVIISLGYLAAGVAWILGSDYVVDALILDRDWLHAVNSAKGVIFVVVTALALYLTLRPLMTQIGRANAQAVQSGRNYRAAFEGSPAPMWLTDPASGLILDANPAAAQLYGVPRDRLIGRRLADLAIDGSARDHGEQIHRGDDGRRIELELAACTIERDGTSARLIAARDVSLIMSSQRERENAIARLEETQRQALLASWEMDVDSGAIEVTPQVFHMLGDDAARPVDARGLCAVPWREFRARVADADAGLIADAAQRLRAGEPRIDLVYRLRHRDGSLRWFHSRGRLERGPVGLRLRGTLQDITELRRAEETLRRHERQFRELLALLPDAVLIVRDGRVAYANAACSALFARAEPPLGAPVAALADGGRLDHIAEQLGAGSDVDADATLREDSVSLSVGGERRRVALAARRVHFEGAPAQLLVLRDLTPGERMHERLAAAHAELEAVTRRLISVQEDERAMLSRELHDDVGQALTALKLGVLGLGDAVDAELRQEMIATADETIAKIRDISMMLRPPQLDALGLEAALRWQVGTLCRDRGLLCDVAVDTLPRRPSDEIELAVFRIAQESLTNILRHAQAQRVRVALSATTSGLRLEVEDDGRGFDPAGASGYGLVTMRERARLAGGELVAQSQPGCGCRIRADVPYESPRAA